MEDAPDDRRRTGRARGRRTHRGLVPGILWHSPAAQGVVAGLLVLLATVGCAWIFYSKVESSLRQRVGDEPRTFADLAALRIDPGAHAALTRPEQRDGEDYLALIEPLREIARANRRILDIYTIRRTSQGLCVVLALDLQGDSADDAGPGRRGLGRPYLERDPVLAEAAWTGEQVVPPVRSSDRRGAVYSAFVPVRHADGRLECVLGVDMDLTEFEALRVGIRRALLLSCGVATLLSAAAGAFVTIYQRTKRDYMDRIAASELRYALVVNAANEGLWDWNLRSGSLYLSDRLRWMLGIREPQPPSAVGVASFLDRLHPGDRERVRRALDDHLAGRSRYDNECRLRIGDGTYRRFHARGQAVRDAEGRPVRFVGSLVDVTDRARLRRQLRRAARLDRLTRLPNRAALLGQLRRVIRADRDAGGVHYALLFLDFDRFKIVNDSLGHDAGDALLVQIASRLRSNLRRGDGVLRGGSTATAARIGGDEFVVLLEGLAGPDDAARVAGRLLQDLADPYVINSYRVRSTASIGIVLGDPRYGRAEDLLRDADTAMYEAKAARRGGFAIFDDAMRARVRRRMLLEQGLRDAIAGDRLGVAYQPIVCLESGRVVSVEALARWEHPELGPISPAEFVPLAEECGLVVPLGDRVLDRALGQVARWRAGGGDGVDPIPGVGVNLSRHHLLMPGLADRLLRSAEAVGVDPAEVCLELTESAMMHDVDAARDALRSLREAGFRLAIDDFGIGYSSLACLHQFPFDLLKIDRSFVEGLCLSTDRAAIVRTITSLAGILGFRVVAEGIETPEQLALLRELGCDYGQGFYFARPAPAGAVPPSVTLPAPREVRHKIPC